MLDGSRTISKLTAQLRQMAAQETGSGIDGAAPVRTISEGKAGELEVVSVLRNLDRLRLLLQ